MAHWELALEADVFLGESEAGFDCVESHNPLSPRMSRHMCIYVYVTYSGTMQGLRQCRGYGSPGRSVTNKYKLIFDLVSFTT